MKQVLLAVAAILITCAAQAEGDNLVLQCVNGKQTLRVTQKPDGKYYYQYGTGRTGCVPGINGAGDLNFMPNTSPTTYENKTVQVRIYNNCVHFVTLSDSSNGVGLNFPLISCERSN